MSDKHQLARVLEEIAVFLELKGENPFKIKAYHTASRTIDKVDMDMAELAK
ncbi:MAG: Helix-hairpin-helix domain [Anaerospora sp.]|nr:Helix-hairpin-helix domain [Anaerospora sp.]